ncbi:hypothetical protein NQL31_000060 [Lotmaria passim]
MAASPAAPPTSSSYVDMLMAGNEGDAFTALETIREAGGGCHTGSAAADGDDGVSRSRNDVTAQAGPRGRELAFRISTPERIRHRSEVLYSEIHTIMQRHEARTGREREVQRRVSRGSRVPNAGGSRVSTTRRDSSPAQTGSTTAADPPFPDLHQMFEESRRAHLTEAQEQRTYFPLSSKPTTYSSKDPSTFSYRFQFLEPPSSGK